MQDVKNTVLLSLEFLLTNKNNYFQNGWLYVSHFFYICKLKFELSITVKL